MVVLLFEKPLRVISTVAILAYTPTTNREGFSFSMSSPMLVSLIIAILIGLK